MNSILNVLIFISLIILAIVLIYLFFWMFPYLGTHNADTFVKKKMDEYFAQNPDAGLEVTYRRLKLYEKKGEFGFGYKYAHAGYKDFFDKRVIKKGDKPKIEAPYYNYMEVYIETEENKSIDTLKCVRKRLGFL